MLFKVLKSCAGVIVVLFAGIALATPAVGVGERQIAVSISSSKAGESIFRWTMRPGESKTASVVVTNKSKFAGYAYTYSGNTATLIGGGLTTEARTARPSQPTRWTTYKDERLTLQAEQQVTRTFTVTIPKKTKPGDYSTAIIVENLLPTEGSRKNLQQITRTSTPILINVPGKREPALAIANSAEADKSNVSVGVANTGNQNLVPVLTMSIRPEGGDAIYSRNNEQLLTFLAGDKTSVELPLEEPLGPGQYYVDVAFSAPELATPVVRNNIPLLIPGDKPVLEQDVAGMPIWLILLIVLLILAVVVAFIIVRRRRRRRNQLVASVAEGTEAAGLAIVLKSTTALELTSLLGDSVIDFRGSPNVAVTDLVAVLPGDPTAVSVVEGTELNKVVEDVLQTQSAIVIVPAGTITGALAAQPDSLPALIEVTDTHAAAVKITRRLAR